MYGKKHFIFKKHRVFRFLPSPELKYEIKRLKLISYAQ